MGSLNLPASGIVYVDAQILIYSIELHKRYAAALEELWRAGDRGQIVIATSELSVLETLVHPVRSADPARRRDFENLFANGQLQLIPITRDVLRSAADLRASHVSLRTPDAIHAATATLIAASLFLTNDRGFRGIAGLTVSMLDDHVPDAAT